MDKQFGPVPGIRFTMTIYLVDEHGNEAEKTLRGLPFLPPISPAAIDADNIMGGLQLDTALPEGSGRWRLMTEDEVRAYRADDAGKADLAEAQP